MFVVIFFPPKIKNKQKHTPQVLTMLPSGRFCCGRRLGCLATGTSLESGVTVTSRVSGQPDKRLQHSWGVCFFVCFCFFIFFILQ